MIQNRSSKDSKHRSKLREFNSLFFVIFGKIILSFESRKAVIEDDQPFLPKNHRKRKPDNRDLPSTSATIVLSSGESDDETDNKQDSKAEDAELQYLLQALVNFFRSLCRMIPGIE